MGIDYEINLVYGFHVPKEKMLLFSDKPLDAKLDTYDLCYKFFDKFILQVKNIEAFTKEYKYNIVMSGFSVINDSEEAILLLNDYNHYLSGNGVSSFKQIELKEPSDEEKLHMKEVAKYLGCDPQKVGWNLVFYWNG